MLRRVLRDSVLYSASALLSRGVAIVLVPLYTRFLQPAEYGALDLLTVVATLVNYLVLLEISQGVARVYADAKTERDKQECVSTALWFTTAAYGVFLILALPFSAAIAGLLLDSPKWSEAVRAITLAIAANGLFFMLQDLLRWQLQPWRHGLASIVYTAVSTAVGVAFVVGADSGVPGILYGQCAGATAGFIAAWANGAAKHWRLAFLWKRWQEMVSYSAPQMLSSIAAYFSLYIDRLMIKEFMTLDDVGVYGIGARFASVVALLMTGFQSALVPLVFQNFSSPETPPQLARVFRYFLTLAISAVLLLSGFSRDLVWLFTTAHYYAAWSVVPLLATAVLLANMYIFTLGVYIARRMMLVIAINIGAALINLAGNLLLIPLFGLLGAAVATVLSGLVAFSSYVYCNQRYYPIPFEWGKIAGGVLVGAGFAGILAGIQASSWPSVTVFVVNTALWVLGSTGVAFCVLGGRELQLAARKLWERMA